MKVKEKFDPISTNTSGCGGTHLNPQHMGGIGRRIVVGGQCCKKRKTLSKK
jgi:hypothetical protein